MSETIEEVRALLTPSRSGSMNSIKNCVIALMSDPTLEGAIRKNELTGRTDIVKELCWKRDTPALTDTDLNYLMFHLEEAYALTNEKKILKAVSIVANGNKYHPIRDYLNSLEWDGTERVRYALHRYLGADTSDMTYEFLKLFMLGAVRRVFEPGCKFETMLCLVGGQGAGKSTFFPSFSE